VTDFLSYLINGISLGGIYALIALGFVIVFKATEVVNFAHGSLLVLGGYVIARLHNDVPFVVAVLAGCGVAAVAAVNIVLVTELTRRFGPDILSTGDPWGNHVVDLGFAEIAEARLVGIAVTAVLLAAFFAAFKYSSWGIAMRAGAEDGEAAALMGIRRGRVTMTAWAVAGVLATVAAVFLCAFPTPGLDASVRLTALRAFPAAILGGHDSTAGAVVGGLAIGIAEAMTSGYNVKLGGGSLNDVVPYLVMLLVLLVRPSGLLGTKEVARV
jgi:branched-chain amino acid transport system permease protein